MRSLREETKFHQTWRGPSSGAPPITAIASAASRVIVIRSVGRNTSSRPARELVTRDVDLARHDIDPALLAFGVERHRGAGIERDIGEQRLRRGRERRARAEHRAGDDAHGLALAVHDRQLVAVEMGEARIDLLLGARHPDPELQAVQRLAVAAVLRRGALGMHDAAPGRHPVHRARMDRGLHPEVVAVDDFTVVKISESREPDMRMRPHVEAVPALEFRRAEMIEEHERPDGAARAMRQRPAHRKSVEVDAARTRPRFPARRRRNGRPPRGPCREKNS